MLLLAKFWRCAGGASGWIQVDRFEVGKEVGV